MAISYQLNKSQNQLFSSSKHSSFGFMFALLLAVLLMIADYHYRYLGLLRGGFSLLIAPIQYTVDYPGRIIASIHSLVRSKKALIDENMALRYEQTRLEAQLQKLLVIRHENSELKALLQASSKNEMQAMAAQILAVDTGSARQLLVLNRGKRDGVFVGQPVLDAKGVMGQVVDVGLITSTVMLISDAKSAVPVRNQRTGERAILTGDNSLSHLSLINMPHMSDIKTNDLLVTSGLGRRYPEGYPVGRVEAVMNRPGEEFITIKVRPLASLNRSRLVLLIWPEKEHEEVTKQIHQQMALMKNK